MGATVIKKKLLTIYNLVFWELVWLKIRLAKSIQSKLILTLIKITRRFYLGVRIKIRYQARLVNGTLVKDYGNFFLCLGVHNMIKTSSISVQSEFSINERVKDRSLLSKDLQDYLAELDFLKKKFEAKDSDIKKNRRFWINLKIGPFAIKRMQFEHLMPSLAYMLYKSGVADSNFFLSSKNPGILQQSKNAEKVFWAFRHNPTFPHRNSKLDNFINNFHYLTSKYPFCSILISSSASGISVIRKKILEHDLIDCDCEIARKCVLLENSEMKSVVDEVLSSKFFFSENLHGLCDFVFFTKIPFEIQASPYRLHPRNSEVKSGFYYPWHLANQVTGLNLSD